MQIRWTKGASLNLEQIEEYIAEDNTLAAIHMVLKIIKAVGMLQEHPGLGRAGRISGTRELVVAGTPYIVPYRVKNGFIEVLRVLHGARQWPKNLKD